MVYLRITDPKGRKRIEMRQASDVERFIASVTKQYLEEKGGPSIVEVVTREDYLASIKKKP